MDSAARGDPLIDRDHRRQRKLDDLRRALELAPRRALPSAMSSFDTAVTHGRPSSSAAIGPTVAFAESIAMSPEQDEIVAAALELRGERARDREVRRRARDRP